MKEAEDSGITPAVFHGDTEGAKATEDGVTEPADEDVPMTIDNTSESAPEVYSSFIDVSPIKVFTDDIL